MKYSYEYKKQCVELYRQGKWPETPVGEKQKNFHKTIRKWARMEEAVEDNRLLCYTGQVATTFANGWTEITSKGNQPKD